MATLLDKIHKAAASRLVLPANRKPAQELDRYRKFLKVETHRLKILHRGGASGSEVSSARAAVLDVLLKYILEAVLTADAAPDGTSASAAKRDAGSLALVAIGGYGRGELNPFSDIDILFLHDGTLVKRGRPTPYLSSVVDGLLYTLWDIGLKVGHSVRTVPECVAAANDDMQTKTALIEARLVFGAPGLFEKLRKAIEAKCVKGHETEYIKARLDDQKSRRLKFGASVALQEPNIKNGCGGLRDYQSLFWMAFVKYRSRSPADLEEKKLISETERKMLEGGYDFLLRVRTELHYQEGRQVDVLRRNVQPTVAQHLGYTERSPRKRLESFMHDVYRHLRNLHLLTRLLEERLSLLPQPARLPSLRQIIHDRTPRPRPIDGFRFVDGRIHAASSRVFRDQPRRLMRVFLHAQQRGLRLHPDLAQLLRNNLQLIGRDFLGDAHIRETFLEILNQRGSVAPVLRSMHELGLLGKYLPEFGKLTCLVQHEFYHQYTADEHTLECIAKLDEIWEAKSPPASQYTDMFLRVERPYVLYLALLLHDAGKAVPGKNHCIVGAKLAVRVAKRLDLNEHTTQTLCLLIKHHLTMVQISQRRDLDDPAEIRSFAEVVQTEENLRLLTLHTFSDSRGTSKDLWNDFKNSLLLTLFDRARQDLLGGTVFIHAEARQREKLVAGTRRFLPKTLAEEEIRAHLENMPPRYFRARDTREMAEDVATVHRFMHLQISEEGNKALAPVVNWNNQPDRGHTALHLCTWDRAGLFSTIAGSLAAAGLNILSAQIFTRQDGIVLDVFLVTSASTGLLAQKDEKAAFERIIREALIAGRTDFDPLIRPLLGGSPRYTTFAEDWIAIDIAFDNDTSPTRTVIDVESEDRVGLLYYISRALHRLDLDIVLAKISTEKGAAIDTFYVRDADGNKILSADRQSKIRKTLTEAIQRIDARSSTGK